MLNQKTAIKPYCHVDARECSVILLVNVKEHVGGAVPRHENTKNMLDLLLRCGVSQITHSCSSVMSHHKAHFTCSYVFKSRLTNVPELKGSAGESLRWSSDLHLTPASQRAALSSLCWSWLQTPHRLCPGLAPYTGTWNIITTINQQSVVFILFWCI